MDNRINAFLESLVLEVLQTSPIGQYPQPQKDEYVQKLRDYFNTVIFDTMIDNFTPEQINILKEIPIDSPQMRDKIEEFASITPLLLEKIEKVLEEEVVKVKQNPQVIYSA